MFSWFRPRLGMERLVAAFEKDLAFTWCHFCQEHPDHVPYAFVLYGLEEDRRLRAFVLTEQNLTKVAEYYVKRGLYDTVEEARHSFRYAVNEFDGLTGRECRLPSVDGIVDKVSSASFDYDLVGEAAMRALRLLDSRGLFGAGTARDRMILMIINENLAAEWTIATVEILNPKSVSQLYLQYLAATKIKGVFARCDSIAVSADGRSLFSAGSRDDEDESEPGSTNSHYEIVSFEVQGQHLVRRWTLSFPIMGEGVRELVSGHDGKSFIVLRRRYSGSICETRVMRFAFDREECLQQYSFSGEPSSLAVSPDGSRVAVAMCDHRMYLLDQQLSLIATFRLDVRPFGILFYDSEQLLVATKERLLRISVATWDVEATIPLPSFRLATDARRTLLAVSRGSFDESQEFGVHLLSLPGLAPVNTFLVPGHKAVTVALSPDGRRLAFEAQETGKYRTFVVVFDIATGQELARKKSDSIDDLAFLHDSQTLGIADAGFTESEAIELWRIADE